MNLAPVLFVLLWSTGFVGAKYGLPYADPFIFLAIRVLIAALLLYLFATFSKGGVKLNKAELRLSAKVGATLHFAYLGGVFYAISKGLPAGVAATVTSLQPILVSFIGIKVLNESINLKQVFGLIFGFGGVVLVLSPAFTSAHHVTLNAIIAILSALAGSTFATLIQKKSGGNVPLIPGTAFQYVVAAALFFFAAFLTQGFHIEWSGKFLFAISWLVLALSVGAVLILLTLLKHGSASKVSSLLYLVPPATTIEAYFLFKERISAIELCGIALTALGVFLVIKKDKFNSNV